MMASYRVRRFGALGLALFAVLLISHLALHYAAQRLQLARDRAEIEAQYRMLLHRRVDISVLQHQLERLNASAQVRQSTLEAANDRGALARLQQMTRAAIDQAKGKLLSATEAKPDQDENSVALLVRARLEESAVPQLIGQVESGNPRLRLDDVSLVSRSLKPGEPGEVEMTATFRARWSPPGKS